MISNRSNREKIYSTAAYWDSKAVEFEGDAISMWPNNHLNRYYHTELTLMVDRFFPTVRGLEILDVGCGTGRISYYLANRGAVVLGVDFSAKMIELAQRKSMGGNPRFRVQSVFDFNDHELYDGIVSWGSITFACSGRTELLDVLRRLRKGLKSDGRLLLLEPIHHGFLHRVLDMNMNEFCNILAQEGFKVREIRPMHFWPCRLLLAYVSLPGFITAPVYHLGQWIMGMGNYPAWGDYKAIYAEADRTVRAEG
jgi:2-polyprenyl-3-methyl-5-hydroxy-6-metoxy-1,4-benzoquinol methylase